ncbi:hypothetical protein [uncultured Legionella sp.]|uniref:hypothetical protein n=1 Tax=uncultured Legionella sp. TaxID=210934 RepID=UPI00260D1A9F|nr:hypothetical protein [uncultured Legionella sp.]
MVKRLKGVLILSLSVLALNANAHYESKETLIVKSRDLAETIISLVSSQEKKVCVEKLVLASSQIEMAANWMVGDAYFAAKKNLDSAVSALQYAELTTCNRYIQIAHSKFEAQRIKHSF